MIRRAGFDAGNVIRTIIHLEYDLAKKATKLLHSWFIIVIVKSVRFGLTVRAGGRAGAAPRRPRDQEGGTPGRAGAWACESRARPWIIVEAHRLLYHSA